MFRFFQPEKTNDAHYTVLMNDLHQTAQDLQDAYRNLENVIDPDMMIAAFMNYILCKCAINFYSLV